MVDLLQQYFDQFGDKAVCYEDLQPYISLDADDLSRWSSFLTSIPFSSVSMSYHNRL